MMAHSTGIPAGLLKTFKPNVKYLLTLQEGDPPEYIEKLARPVWPLFKRAFTKADALQPISTFLFNWGRRMGFKGEAEVIPNAVNIAHFSKEISSDERNKFRAKLGLTENDFILITTSRLVNKNAVDDVISSLVFLPEKVHFVVCGIGPDEEKLQELTVKNNLQSRVHFIGQIGHDELPKALKSCDIFIRPSRSEGMGNSFIEAMAAGVPVIATQEGGIADFLFDAKKNPEKETTGWAVDKDSPKQIAEAVKDIMENSEKVAFVTATAKKLVGEKYDWDTVAEKMKMVYNKLCK